MINNFYNILFLFIINSICKSDVTWFGQNWAMVVLKRILRTPDVYAYFMTKIFLLLRKSHTPLGIILVYQELH